MKQKTKEEIIWCARTFIVIAVVGFAFALGAGAAEWMIGTK